MNFLMFFNPLEKSPSEKLGSRGEVELSISRKRQHGEQQCLTACHMINCSEFRNIHVLHHVIVHVFITYMFIMHTNALLNQVY